MKTAGERLHRSFDDAVWVFRKVQCATGYHHQGSTRRVAFDPVEHLHIECEIVESAHPDLTAVVNVHDVGRQVDHDIPGAGGQCRMQKVFQVFGSVYLISSFDQLGENMSADESFVSGDQGTHYPAPSADRSTWQRFSNRSRRWTCSQHWWVAAIRSDSCSRQKRMLSAKCSGRLLS